MSSSIPPTAVRSRTMRWSVAHIRIFRRATSSFITSSSPPPYLLHPRNLLARLLRRCTGASSRATDHRISTLVQRLRRVMIGSSGGSGAAVTLNKTPSGALWRLSREGTIVRTISTSEDAARTESYHEPALSLKGRWFRKQTLLGHVCFDDLVHLDVESLLGCVGCMMPPIDSPVQLLKLIDALPSGVARAVVEHLALTIFKPERSATVMAYHPLLLLPEEANECKAMLDDDAATTKKNELCVRALRAMRFGIDRDSHSMIAELEAIGVIHYSTTAAHRPLKEDVCWVISVVGKQIAAGILHHRIGVATNSNDLLPQRRRRCNASPHSTSTVGCDERSNGFISLESENDVKPQAPVYAARSSPDTIATMALNKLLSALPTDFDGGDDCSTRIVTKEQRAEERSCVQDAMNCMVSEFTHRGKWLDALRIWWHAPQAGMIPAAAASFAHMGWWEESLRTFGRLNGHTTADVRGYAEDLRAYSLRRMHFAEEARLRGCVGSLSVQKEDDGEDDGSRRREMDYDANTRPLLALRASLLHRCQWDTAMAQFCQSLTARRVDEGEEGGNGEGFNVHQLPVLALCSIGTLCDFGHNAPALSLLATLSGGDVTKAAQMLHYEPFLRPSQETATALVHSYIGTSSWMTALAVGFSHPQPRADAVALALATLLAATPAMGQRSCVVIIDAQSAENRGRRKGQRPQQGGRSNVATQRESSCSSSSSVLEERLAFQVSASSVHDVAPLLQDNSPPATASTKFCWPSPLVDHTEQWVAACRLWDGSPNKLGELKGMPAQFIAKAFEVARGVNSLSAHNPSESVLPSFKHRSTVALTRSHTASSVTGRARPIPLGEALTLLQGAAQHLQVDAAVAILQEMHSSNLTPPLQSIVDLFDAFSLSNRVSAEDLKGLARAVRNNGGVEATLKAAALRLAHSVSTVANSSSQSTTINNNNSGWERALQALQVVQHMGLSDVPTPIVRKLLTEPNEAVIRSLIATLFDMQRSATSGCINVSVNTLYSLSSVLVLLGYRCKLSCILQSPRSLRLVPASSNEGANITTLCRVVRSLMRRGSTPQWREALGILRAFGESAASSSGGTNVNSRINRMRLSAVVNEAVQYGALCGDTGAIHALLPELFHIPLSVHSKGWRNKLDQSLLPSPVKDSFDAFLSGERSTTTESNNHLTTSSTTPTTTRRTTRRANRSGIKLTADEEALIALETAEDSIQLVAQGKKDEISSDPINTHSKEEELDLHADSIIALSLMMVRRNAGAWLEALRLAAILQARAESVERRRHGQSLQRLRVVKLAQAILETVHRHEFKTGQQKETAAQNSSRSLFFQREANAKRRYVSRHKAQQGVLLSALARRAKRTRNSIPF